MKQNNQNLFSAFVRKIALAICFLGISTLAFAQSQVKGTVKDANGLPVIGATVIVDGTTTGTTTDANGQFVLKADDKATLTVSYLGFKDTQVAVAGKTAVEVILEEDAAMLDDVVVIGYGAIKKRDLTGSVASVKAEDLMRTPTGNVMEAIQGQVAGFDITRSNGDAGASMKMTMRGNRSVNATNEPLFIIDGMEGSFDELNPNDIASVEVLKDASSTAIYGAAGANGVVIITTKNPAKDKFSINLDAYYGWNVPSKFPELNTGEAYKEFRREALRTVGQWNSAADDATLFPSNIQSLMDNGQWVDWADEATRTGQTQSYNVSSSYANDRVSSYFSLGYYNVEGQLPDDELTRYSIRGKLDFTPKSWLKYGVNVYGMWQDNDKRYSKVWNRILCTPPLGTPYDETGEVVPFPLNGNTAYMSPIADMGSGQYVNNVKTLSIAPQAYIEIKPVKGLTLRSVLGGYFRNTKQGVYIGPDSWEGLQTGTTARIPNTLNYNYKWQNILTYNITVADDHDFTVTGVTEWTKNRTEGVSASAFGFDSNTYAYHNMGAATGTPTVSSNFVGTQMMSYAARLNYSYKGKYLLSISSRWDGASVLADGNKWDVFPAAAAAWRISDENFMQNQKTISNLKLRASYGVTGNAAVAAYGTQAAARLGVFGFQETTVAYSGYAGNISNPNLGWEKSYSWNVGLDLGLWKDRLNITADWYRTDTKDLLYEQSLPYELGGYASGAFTIWSNIGETRNTGLELTVNGRILTGAFKWNSTVTFAANKEEVIKTTSNQPLQYEDYYLIEGEPIHTYYGYKYMGIWGTDDAEEAAKFGQKPGDVRVYDNGDGTLNTDDYQILGSSTPKWTGSWANNFSYKNFDLNILMIARWDYSMYYGITGWYRADGINPSPAICDYWTPENQGGRYPRPNAEASGQVDYQDRIDYYDGSYWKIKTISLGYTVPKKHLKKLGVEKLRVYFTADNPFIHTKSGYLKNYDPEKGGDDDYAPLSRQYVFGVNLSF